VRGCAARRDRGSFLLPSCRGSAGAEGPHVPGGDGRLRPSARRGQALRLLAAQAFRTDCLQCCWFAGFLKSLKGLDSLQELAGEFCFVRLGRIEAT